VLIITLGVKKGAICITKIILLLQVINGLMWRHVKNC